MSDVDKDTRPKPSSNSEVMEEALQVPGREEGSGASDPLHEAFKTKVDELTGDKNGLPLKIDEASLPAFKNKLIKFIQLCSFVYRKVNEIAGLTEQKDELKEIHDEIFSTNQICHTVLLSSWGRKLIEIYTAYYNSIIRVGLGLERTEDAVVEEAHDDAHLASSVDEICSDDPPPPFSVEEKVMIVVEGSFYKMLQFAIRDKSYSCPEFSIEKCNDVEAIVYRDRRFIAKPIFDFVMNFISEENEGDDGSSSKSGTDLSLENGHFEIPYLFLVPHQINDELLTILFPEISDSDKKKIMSRIYFCGEKVEDYPSFSAAKLGEIIVKREAQIRKMFRYESYLPSKISRELINCGVSPQKVEEAWHKLSHEDKARVCPSYCCDEIYTEQNGTSDGYNNDSLRIDELLLRVIESSSDKYLKEFNSSKFMVYKKKYRCFFTSGLVPKLTHRHGRQGIKRAKKLKDDISKYPRQHDFLASYEVEMNSGVEGSTDNFDSIKTVFINHLMRRESKSEGLNESSLDTYFLMELNKPENHRLREKLLPAKGNEALYIDTYKVMNDDEYAWRVFMSMHPTLVISKKMVEKFVKPLTDTQLLHRLTNYDYYPKNHDTEIALLRREIRGKVSVIYRDEVSLVHNHVYLLNLTTKDARQKVRDAIIQQHRKSLVLSPT